ncbi:MAG: helicase [Leptospiraceae bacterium]|nr:helicase [Leptospiraceae bacterium]
MSTPTPLQIRKELLSLVHKDLLGPANGNDEEVKEDNLLSRYLVGKIAPRNERIDEDEEENDVGAEGAKSNETEKSEKLAFPKFGFYPSSIGMSFTIDGKEKAFLVSAEWGQYERKASDGIYLKENKEPEQVWKRLHVNTPRDIEIVLEDKKSYSLPLQPYINPNIKLEVTIRKVTDGDWFISLFLVNTTDATALGTKSAARTPAWIFQPVLRAKGIGGKAVFTKKTINKSELGISPSTLQEEKIQEINYRNLREFGVGHGVAVAVKHSVKPDCAYEIETDFLPEYIVPQVESTNSKVNAKLEGLVLGMKELSELPSVALSKNLHQLVDTYKDWIDTLRKRSKDSSEDLESYQKTIGWILSDCTSALTRMKEAISLIEENPQAREAFQFANKSMYLQRIHTIYSQSIKKKEKKSLGEIENTLTPEWRLFQLAFILINLPGLTDLNHSDRSESSSAIADLLWFPTGGGKTEAYLGLTAYTFAIRRLQGNIENHVGEFGVAVIMRYTLRLLTLQQFQRASALVCATEVIRREDSSKWGHEPFRIGLWVGQGTTPNYTKDAATAINNKKGQGYNPSKGSPFQLTNCPWCGTILTHNEYEARPYAEMEARTFVRCPNYECDFSDKKSDREGIPILLVDEEIYRRLPTLLISTVDKFAQMPWKGTVQMLFGHVDAYCERHGFITSHTEDSKKGHTKTGSLPAATVNGHSLLRPPDLIIQDELHLISGPLGTLVGLYETAVDELCSWTVNGKKVRPKVIASTATIRQASEQIEKLFIRTAKVFPPPGIDVKDNFFAIQKEETQEEASGRLYLGICPVGEKMKVSLIRVYVVFLSAAKLLHDKYKTADTYMTLVGYFNSIRELGGMRRLVDDDVKARLREMESRGLTKRFINALEELTSRISAEDIPKILDRLEVPFKENGAIGIDVLLATNMISVGVDVNRLGLMVVAGQPKSTSEYIQATSRVGRNSPGIVCTVYNWVRPRDISHFERFRYYHSTFYKNVEALSLTPYSLRALDRGLTGVLVSIIRQSSHIYNENISAGTFLKENALVKQAFRVVLERAMRLNPESAPEIETMIQDRLELWEKLIRDNQSLPLGYKKKKKEELRPLLIQPEEVIKGLNITKLQQEKFTCLNSLREVEPGIGLILQGDEQ